MCIMCQCLTQKRVRHTFNQKRQDFTTQTFTLDTSPNLINKIKIIEYNHTSQCRVRHSDTNTRLQSEISVREDC